MSLSKVGGLPFLIWAQDSVLYMLKERIPISCDWKAFRREAAASA